MELGLYLEAGLKANGILFEKSMTSSDLYEEITLFSVGEITIWTAKSGDFGANKCNLPEWRERLLPIILGFFDQKTRDHCV